MMGLLQRRQIFPMAEARKKRQGAAGEKHKQTLARRRKAEEKKKVFLYLLLVLNAQFFIFKGLVDEIAAASEVTWVHNGAINCCFVALLDLTNG